MGFSSAKDLVDEIAAGGRIRVSFQKVYFSSLAGSAGRWYDMSIMQGDPQANLFPVSTAAKAATQLNYLSAGNIWHGTNKSPKTKHLKSALMYCTAATSAPISFLLSDYLLYYPLVNPDATGAQTLNNTITLPRYTDGEGVQIFVVATTDLGPLASTIVVDYMNSDGVDHQVAAGTFYPPSGAVYPITVSANANKSVLINTGGAVTGCAGPFIPLAPGDHGVRRVNSIQFNPPMGGGTVAVLLAKPLATIPLTTVSVPSERDYLTQIPSLPRIVDGAFLGVMMQASVGVVINTTYQGYFEYIFG